MGKNTEATPGDIILVDHEKKIVEYALDTFKARTPQELKEDVEELIRHPAMRNDALLDKVEFVPSKGWLRGEKEETINGFQTKLFDMTGFNYVFVTRKGKGDSKSNSDLPQNYWTSPTDDPKGKGYGLLYEDETLSKKQKQFKGTLWLSPDFPRNIKELLPIFEILAPSQKHFGKLKSFIELKFPDYGFPVKLDVPVFPTLSAVVTFLNYQEKEIDQEQFIIPSTYNKSQIQLNFEFDKQETRKEIQEAKEQLLDETKTLPEEEM